ncbi:MAG: 50S ribosomal protein L25/general stress protein Ctc [Cocleimonas sp.]|nr:50S ribosomal protein L25/general stress protein Ctc [Cocleimonas sp.]
MANTFGLTATTRTDLGKGASRRLRREGSIPAVVYGGASGAASITLKSNQMNRNLLEEAFYSSLINLEIDGNKEIVMLRDLQRHPSRPFILHVDLQRIMDDEKIKVIVPLHFINEEEAPGVKLEGGNVNRLLVDVEVFCLPKDIPEYINVDLSKLHRGGSIHLNEIKIPDNVALTQLMYDGHNLAVVAVN